MLLFINGGSVVPVKGNGEPLLGEPIDEPLSEPMLGSTCEGKC